MVSGTRTWDGYRHGSPNMHMLLLLYEDPDSPLKRPFLIPRRERKRDTTVVLLNRSVDWCWNRVRMVDGAWASSENQRKLQDDESWPVVEAPFAY